LLLNAIIPTLLRHEGTADTFRPFIDRDCQGSWTWRGQDHRRRQLAHEAAAPDYPSFTATCAQSHGTGSFHARFLVIVSQPTSSPAGGRDYPAINTAEISPPAPATEVPQLYSSSRKGKPGPKGPSPELIQAIVALKRRNPRFGCPRIAQQINKAFGTDIDKDVVRRVLATHYRPSSGGGGPSWLTFLGHMKDSLWSVDLFRCESILLQSHWVLVVMDQFTRRIIGFGVHAGDVDGIALCRMFNTVVSSGDIPKYLSSDNDPLFLYHQWQANLRILGADEIKTIPYTPLSHPFVERLIGTIRREYLDLALFWNANDLARKLDAFRQYYNTHRIHTALDGATPSEISEKSEIRLADLNRFQWKSHCRGLYKLPVAA
jgi:putative transposase